MSVQEAQSKISSKEFSEWQAYGTLEPWHNPQLDHYLSLMCSMFANMHRDSKRKPIAFDQYDFMPEFLRKHEPEKPPESVAGTLKLWAQTWKAKHEAKTRQTKPRNSA